MHRWRDGRCRGAQSLAATRHLVQRTERQPAFRQMCVHRRQPERQGLAKPAGAALDAGNSLAEILQGGWGGCDGHAFGGDGGKNVLSMFYYT